MKKSLGIETIIVDTIIGVTILSGIFLTTPMAQAETTNTDAVSFTISPSCSLELDGNSTNEHSATINNGDTGILGSTRIKAFCNDADGYSIYAAGFSNNTHGDNKLYRNGVSSDFDINTGTSGDTSWWSMKLTGGNGEDSPNIVSSYSDYQSVPDSYAKVAYRTSGTNMTNADEAYFDTSYQVHISTSQPTGTYTGSVKYVMVHPTSAVAPPTTIDEVVYLQDFADLNSIDRASVINSMAYGETYVKKDKRDEQEYTIARLPNWSSTVPGVWMTKNLNLAGGTKLTSDTTDFDPSYTLPDDQGWWEDGRLPISGVDDFIETNYAYVYNSNSTTCAGDSPCYSYYSWDAATLGSGRTLTTANENAPYSICPKGWKLPNTFYGSNRNTGMTSDYWRFLASVGGTLLTPYPGVINNTSLASHAIQKIQSSPYNLPLAGYIGKNSFGYGGDYGMYWSSTAYPYDGNGAPNDFALYLDLRGSSTAARAANIGYRNIGNSVRCLLK